MSAHREGGAASGDRDRIFARAVATSEFALGLAHALNNALTVIAGEASFVQSERKDDPILDEACSLIQAQVARCARMTRALQLRRGDAGCEKDAAAAHCDVVRSLRDLAPILEDALSRRMTLTLETPEDELLVDASPADVQTIWLLLTYDAAAGVRGNAGITLRAFEDHGEIVICAETERTGAAPPEAMAPVASCAEAIDALAQRIGATHTISADATQMIRRLAFRRAAD